MRVLDAAAHLGCRGAGDVVLAARLVKTVGMGWQDPVATAVFKAASHR
jgi:hypothetical protein